MPTKIGSVSGSTTGIQPQVPSLRNPLEGLARGVTDLGNTITEIGQTVNTRRNALDTAQAQVDLIRLKGEIAVEQAEMAKAYDPTGRGFMETAEGSANKKLDAYYAALSPEVQRAMAPDVAQARASFKLGAYDTQVSMETLNYKSGLATMQQTAMDEILSGKSSIDEWVPKLQTYIANSPLSQQETADIAQKMNQTLSQVDYFVQSRDEMLHWEQYTGNSNGWAAGMPAAAQGLLNTILQSESGGNYNAMYTPEGEALRTFSDMKDHPNQGAMISSGPNAGQTSTAAGGFQFTKETWDRAKAALGLPDFSPVSQQKAAWWLAQQDYRSRTGRDLMADLASGDGETLAGVRRALAPTWEALANMSDAQFASGVLQGRDIPPEALDDPRYADVPYMDRLNGLDTARAKANEKLTQMFRDQKSVSDALLSQFRSETQAGLHNDAEIIDFVQKNYLGQDTLFSLLNDKDTQMTDAIATQRLVAALAAPNSVYGPVEQRGLDAVYKNKGSAAVAARDQGYMNSTLLPAINESKMVPAGLAADMTAKLASKNPVDFAYALSNMSYIQQTAPAAFAKAFGDDNNSMIVKYNTLASVMPPEVAAQELMSVYGPENKIVASQLAQVAQQYQAATPAQFTPEGIVKGMGLSANPSGMDPIARSAMMQEANILFMTELQHYSTPGEAWNAAMQIMKANWGETSTGTGEPYPIKYPPERAGLQPVSGTYDWIEEATRSVAGSLIPPGASFRLYSDHQTNHSILNSDAVSYGVDVQLPNGMWVPVLNSELMPFRIELSKRQSETNSVDMGLASRTMNQIVNAISSLEVAKETRFGADPNNPDAAKYDELANLMKWLGQDVVDANPKVPLTAYRTRYFSEGADEAQAQETLKALGYTSKGDLLNDLNGSGVAIQDALIRKLLGMAPKKAAPVGAQEEGGPMPQVDIMGN